MTIEPTYLGDGAYAEFDGYSVCVYTHNGLGRTNEVWLEPELASKLVDYIGRCQATRQCELCGRPPREAAACRVDDCPHQEIPACPSE